MYNNTIGSSSGPAHVSFAQWVEGYSFQSSQREAVQTMPLGEAFFLLGTEAVGKNQEHIFCKCIEIRHSFKNHTSFLILTWVLL